MMNLVPLLGFCVNEAGFQGILAIEGEVAWYKNVPVLLPFQGRVHSKFFVLVSVVLCSNTRPQLRTKAITREFFGSKLKRALDVPES